MRSISSLRRPAALTRKRAVTASAPAWTRKPPWSRRSIAVTGAFSRSSQPARTASVAKASGGVDLPNRRVAVGASAFDDPREGAALPVVPGDEQRARVLHGDAGSKGVLPQQLVTAPHEARLERPGRRVEARVQKRRVGLARSGADVGTRFDERATQLEARKLPGDRRADDSRTDYDDVAVRCRLAHRESCESWASASAAASQRARRSSASAEASFGSKTAVELQPPTASAGVAAPPIPSRASAPAPSAVASGDGYSSTGTWSRSA